MKRRSWACWLSGLVLAVSSLALASSDDEEHDAAEMAAPVMRAPKMRMRQMGATPGGAQDIDYARDRVTAGEIPHPNTFTPEGLLSQHDLPLETGKPCSQILCLTGAAMRAELLAQPEVRHLAQLGFASNLDPTTWKRAPVNLIAVVDKSGSMDGAPLDTVKASLRHLARQMTSKDQLTIVLYGDQTHVHLPTTLLTRRDDVLRGIDAIQSAGSTNMEAGLALGFDVARRTRSGFRGTTRVMLFTDERPNVGRTDKKSFMGMARTASQAGVGMTTIGVGTQFGAELATQVSSVRGGNLFFFSDLQEMQRRFSRDFDTMVTELAYDLKLHVRPAAGYELAGLYGLPGDVVKRTPGGGLEMTVETIFLSKDKGGIFFAFRPAGAGSLPPTPGPVGYASVSYLDKQSRRQRDNIAFQEWKGPLPVGLSRGALLVDEVTVLKRASELHRIENKTEQAYQLVRALEQRFERHADPALAKERELIRKTNQILTRLSGHQGEGGTSSAVARDRVSGLP